MLSGPETGSLADRLAVRLRERDGVMRAFFAREAVPLARAAREIAERFIRGGTLYAFGHGPYATDAAHVSVEFVHPVIVGKRALPAVDASAAPEAIVEALIGEHDVALAFGPPEGDPRMLRALELAQRRGALTLAWPGTEGDYAVRAPSDDPHVHQEAFELLGHTLYESVHVFLEHRRELGDDVGASAFLYPYLGSEQDDAAAIVGDVAASIVEKAHDAERLRERVAAEESGAIAAAIGAICARLDAGGRILAFGNGGSATDATDFVLDCVLEAPGLPSVSAISLAAEPAVLSAIANDVGTELTFLRQLVAQARPNDVAFAFSTSGGSKNVVAALGEARKRGLLTVALLGYDGGEIARRGLADHAIVVRSDYIPRIQEAQAAIYHVMRAAFAEDCE
ncbi:MAG TPA: SIS domain-containing protein [Candidatus Elarobacter sp.]|jgi:D-sedoheptulose 7-phosphate isomerase|nr:SIS domain-containing protein [Candidatus Elarobacter sp.]